MKVPNSLTCLLLGICLMSNGRHDGPNDMHVRFGLIGDNYRELQSSMNSDLSQGKTPTNESKYCRFFTPGEQELAIQATLKEKHDEWWTKFCQETPLTERTQVKFRSYLKDRDVWFYDAISMLAPVLFFEFSGNGSYQLDSITVNRLGFSEYRGLPSSSFSSDSTGYDILLRHTDTLHTYVPPLGRKYVFSNFGGFNLRFWSDNFYKRAGTISTGCYTVKITFYFTANGITAIATTEVFKIDV